VITTLATSEIWWGGGRKKKSLLTIAIESIIIIIIIIILFLKILVKFPHLAKDPHFFCCITKLKEKTSLKVSSIQ